MTSRQAAGRAPWGMTAALLVVASLGLEGATRQAPTVDQAVGGLKSPSTRTRIAALRNLGEAARTDAAVPMAAALVDGNDDVQFAAVESLLELYTVRADLGHRQWGVGAGVPPTTFPEMAFEAGPLATIPAAVPAEVLVNLASVMRNDESARTRLSAAYALGVLAAPDMGPMAPAAVQAVTADTVYAMAHQDARTREVAARVAGRVFAPASGQAASVAIGDALVGAMNDKDAAVREWAMDSLGLLKYERAVQSLTDRASYYGKGAEGTAALHAVARIAAPGSAPVLRAFLANGYIPFRLLAIEGLARIGDRGALPEIGESETSVNDPGVSLAADFARFMFGGDVARIGEALDRPVTSTQARMYLAEIARANPTALHVLLAAASVSTRETATELLGVSRHPEEASPLEPLLRDSSPDIVRAATEAIRRLRAYGAVIGHA